MAEVRTLIVRMATDNRGWGYTRIQGALANLDYDVSRGTIATVLREHGLGPAPERVKRTTWTEFLKTHWVSSPPQSRDGRATSHGSDAIPAMQRVHHPRRPWWKRYED